MSSYNGFECNLRLTDNQKVFVRKIATSDAERLKKFFETLSPESYWLFHPHLFGDEHIEKQIAKAADGTDWTYVALDGDTVAAYFFLWNIKDPIPTLGLGIGDAYQDSGLGHQIMDILISDTTILGKEGVKLTTLVENNRAFHLYSKKGFEYIGDIETVGPAGQKHLEKNMILKLNK